MTPIAASVPEPSNEGEARLRERVAGGVDTDFGDLGAAQRVIRADFLRAVVLAGQATAPTGIRISGALIDGDVDFQYAGLDVPLGFFACEFGGRLRFGRCKLPGLDLLQCRVKGGVWADSIDVAFTLDLEGSTIAGGVRLMGASIGADLNCSGAEVHADDRRLALDFRNARIGGTVFFERAEVPLGSGEWRPFRAEGQVRLSVAQIADSLSGRHAELHVPGGSALHGEGAEFGANLTLESANVNGEVNLLGATVGADAAFADATLTNPNGDALTLDGSRVTGNVLLTGGFDATGTVRAIGATLSSSIQCVDASFRRPGSVALALDNATIGVLSVKSCSFSGGVRLDRASADTLDDDLGTGADQLGSWSGASPLVLTAFSVKRFATASQLELREKWLKSSDHYDPGTWQSLIDVYRADGRDGDARDTAVARENDRLRRGGLSRPRRIFGWIHWALIGHGYRPMRAGLWAVGIVAAFAFLVWYGDEHIVKLKDAPSATPQPFIYAADVFLPIIDFGETKWWRVTDWLQWVQWSVIALGWILTTLFVAGFTRLARA